MLASEKSRFTRRQFCGIALAVPIGVAFSSRSALGATAPAEDASTLHDQGVRMMVRGRTFEKAATCFAKAAQSEPKEPTHTLALGCAYACRAASLARAAAYSQMLAEARTKYPQMLAEWEEAQKDRNNDSYGAPKPTPPPEIDFVTKDDALSYRLKPKELAARLDDLNNKAIAAWDSGLNLSQTPEDKARAHFIRGWGIRLLRKYLALAAPSSNDEEDTSEPPAPPLFTVKKLPGLAEADQEFKAATELAPTNSLYWQAQGDMLDDEDNADDAKKAYLKSVELAPKNVNIWYRLYNQAAPTLSRQDSAKAWPPEALEYLHKAQGRDRNNAWPLYEEASILFRFAPYSMTGPSANRDATESEKEAARNAVRNAESRRNGRRAIDLIEEGNASTQYYFPVYQDSVPDLLTVVWHYDSFMTLAGNFMGYARLRELARACSGYGQFMAQYEKETSEAVRATRAIIGMGLKMSGDWPTKDDPANGKLIIQSLVAAAVVAIGYKALGTVYDTVGDSDSAANVRSENEAFQQQMSAYKAKIKENIAGASEFDTY